MNRLLVSIGSVVWWLVPLVVIVAAIGWQTDWGRHLRPEPQSVEPITPKPVSIAVLPDYELAGGLAARTETTARTLFNPTRRPAPPLVAEAPKPTIKRGQFTLTGTLVVDGKSTAFLREVAGGKSRRVLQGQSINGLLVAEVKPDRVKLTMGDESEDLVLKVQPNPKPTAVAAAPPAAPGAAPPPQAQGQVPPSAPAQPPASGTAGAGDSLAERRRQAREAQATQAGRAGRSSGASGAGWSDRNPGAGTDRPELGLGLPALPTTQPDDAKVVRNSSNTAAGRQGVRRGRATMEAQKNRPVAAVTGCNE
ncbi:MAG: hypothetical protein IPG28_08215 [Betaproteobacteria bacterium]|nr:hypothetical protein [Betaproteobacteria bacterium]